ncbi:helix-turn-helix domain-containing protein [Streptacidiphilus cavernicola]|uniref:Helix-turn-helix domain-containing protein n=1 Tax=Streptacidiphilus cavernicola TaxID=3342716 RepID=A0ABV6VRK2_9ACTN
MSRSPFSSAQQARERVAARLRELRLDAGLTGDALSVKCGWSPAKSSRVEHAKAAPSDADIRAWCTACGQPEQAEDLIAANRQVDHLYVEWRRQQRTGLSRLQDALLPVYEQSRVLRAYSSSMVPGLLQTPEYATALLTAITAFRDIPNDVEQAVASRAKRARILYEGSHRVVILIDEAVLRRTFGGREAMTGQLAHLLDLLRLPSLALGIIPLGSVWETVWLLETFHIFDSSLVSIETLSAYIRITEQNEIELYEKAFVEMGRMAVYGPPARALIESAIDALQ